MQTNRDSFFFNQHNSKPCFGFKNLPSLILSKYTCTTNQSCFSNRNLSVVNHCFSLSRFHNFFQPLSSLFHYKIKRMLTLCSSQGDVKQNTVKIMHIRRNTTITRSLSFLTLNHSSVLSFNVINFNSLFHKHYYQILGHNDLISWVKLQFWAWLTDFSLQHLLGNSQHPKP